MEASRGGPIAITLERMEITHIRFALKALAEARRTKCWSCQLIDAKLRDALDSPQPSREAEAEAREQRLEEALEFAEGQLRPGVAVDATPRENIREAYRCIDAALSPDSKEAPDAN